MSATAGLQATVGGLCGGVPAPAQRRLNPRRRPARPAPQVQIVRIQLRVPEYGWTTQKVFHLLNFIVCGVRAGVFAFRQQVQDLDSMVAHAFLLDLPGQAGNYPKPCGLPACMVQSWPLPEWPCLSGRAGPLRPMPLVLAGRAPPLPPTAPRF